MELSNYVKNLSRDTTTTTTTVTTTTCVSENALSTSETTSNPDPAPRQLKELIQKLLTRILQGNSSTLSELQSYFTELLTNTCTIALMEANRTMEKELDATDISATMSTLPEYIQHWCDPIVIGEEMKLLAERKMYGDRPKNPEAATGNKKKPVVPAISIFEEKEALAICRWEVLDLAKLASGSESIVKECRKIRASYGRAIKTSLQVSEQLIKLNATDVNNSEMREKITLKIISAEETAAKAQAEVERAKIRRMEIEKKKQIEIEEKKKKEELIELKKKEKEENMKKQSLLASNTLNSVPPAPSEKQLQQENKQKELEKQRKLLKSFFVPLKSSNEVKGSVADASVALTEVNKSAVSISSNQPKLEKENNENNNNGSNPVVIDPIEEVINISDVSTPMCFKERIPEMSVDEARRLFYNRYVLQIYLMISSYYLLTINHNLDILNAK